LQSLYIELDESFLVFQIVQQTTVHPQRKIILTGTGKEFIHTPNISTAFSGGLTKPNTQTTICQTNLAKEHSKSRCFLFSSEEQKCH
jgi:hypothetical protein